MKTTILSAIFMAFLSQYSAANMGQGFHECSNAKKVPAKLKGADVCVLAVDCIYGPLPEAFKEYRKQVKTHAVCPMDKCGDTMKCINDAKFLKADTLQIVDASGTALFPNEKSLPVQIKDNDFRASGAAR